MGPNDVCQTRQVPQGTVRITSERYRHQPGPIAQPQPVRIDPTALVAEGNRPHPRAPLGRSRPNMRYGRKLVLVYEEVRPTSFELERAGETARQLRHRRTDRHFGRVRTDQLCETGAGGLYLFSVKDLDSGDVQNGKFVVIK